MIFDICICTGCFNDLSPLLKWIRSTSTATSLFLEGKPTPPEVWSDDGIPQLFLAFPTPSVNLLDPFHRPANPTASPIKGSNTYVARLSLPFTVCTQNRDQVNRDEYFP
nr:hypothetical protein Iba_chr03bCG11600 [Ipomoea batatas]